MHVSAIDTPALAVDLEIMGATCAELPNIRARIRCA
jgi:hypothetical protein